MQCIKRVTFKNVASKKGCLYAGWMTANVLNSWGAWVRFPRNNELIKGLLKMQPRHKQNHHLFKRKHFNRFISADLSFMLPI